MKVKEIEGLIDFIAKSGLDEVSIETEQIKLAVKKNVPVTQQVVSEFPSSSAPMTASQAISGTAAVVVNEPTNSPYIEFKAPMIGTFYKASSPDMPPFVQVGDQIQQGQKLCVIEAMKLFNEIEADVAGTIIKVLVDDASPVEYDQPLFLIDPRSELNKVK
ncbi:MAG: acetyl-CoA carboxylase biotin carboxyl carrier protein [Amoebophilaceae bacterium]|jgi:acetyl-CoA carboxylase biotin carboxyl carrier protein|nr:acetyl-CoA carboxylase biotin carboxyl carrier protein [Amoebophilaceae bacterium]